MAQLTELTLAAFDGTDPAPLAALALDLHTWRRVRTQQERAARLSDRSGSRR